MVQPTQTVTCWHSRLCCMAQGSYRRIPQCQPRGGHGMSLGCPAPQFPYGYAGGGMSLGYGADPAMPPAWGACHWDRPACPAIPLWAKVLWGAPSPYLVLAFVARLLCMQTALLGTQLPPALLPRNVPARVRGARPLAARQGCTSLPKEHLPARLARSRQSLQLRLLNRVTEMLDKRFVVLPPNILPVAMPVVIWLFSSAL